MSEKIQMYLALQFGKQGKHQCVFPAQIAALFLLTFCLQSLSSLVRNPCCLAQEVLAVDEKNQGSFQSRMTVLVPLLARFQGSSALGSELKGLWHGPGVLSRYPCWKAASV